MTKEILQAIRIPPPSAFEPVKDEMVKLVSRLEKSKGEYGVDRARLDALVARAYGLDPADLAYIWTDFRVLAKKYPTYIHDVLRELGTSGRAVR